MAPTQRPVGADVRAALDILTGVGIVGMAIVLILLVVAVFHPII